MPSTTINHLSFKRYSFTHDLLAKGFENVMSYKNTVLACIRHKMAGLVGHEGKSETMFCLERPRPETLH